MDLRGAQVTKSAHLSRTNHITPRQHTPPSLDSLWFPASKKERRERENKNSHTNSPVFFIYRESIFIDIYIYIFFPNSDYTLANNPQPAPMAPAQRLIRFSGTLRRTEAPRRPSTPPPSPPPKKLKPLSEVMAKAGFAVVEKNDYSDVSCEQCGSGERGDELLLCDKCDRGFHMKCVRPIVARVPIGSWLCPNCSGHHRRLRSTRFSFVSVFVVFRITNVTMW